MFEKGNDRKRVYQIFELDEDSKGVYYIFELDVDRIKIHHMVEMDKNCIKDFLLSNGIDIDNDIYNYKNLKNYTKIKDIPVFGCPGGIMPFDEYIERYLLNKSERANTYDSKYDMGNTAELNDEADNDEYQDIAVAQDIIIATMLTENIDEHDLVNNFRRKGGLIDRLNQCH